MKIIFICCVIVIMLVMYSGCTQPFDAHDVQVIPEVTKSMPIPTPTVIFYDTTATVSTTAVTRELTKTPTTKPTMAPTRPPTITPQNTPDSASFICTGDNCGTLSVRLTCNPKMLFKRMAILNVKNPNNATELSAAVAAMGNNFVDVLPDGSVIPITIKPGKYTLVLLDSNNVQVPERGLISSVRNVSVSKGTIKNTVFIEDC